MSSGTPSPVDTYSPINAASPNIAASPVSTISVSVASPVKTASPISNVTCAITAAKPVSNVISQARIGSPKLSRIGSPMPKHSTSPVNPVPVESPESHSSTYSTVYSPNESTASNVDTDCCRNGIKVRRQRLRPWLINQINSGEIPGLVWMDKENMIFKIPWKHFGRPGVDMYLDALLFRRWALHTKKFEQGRPSDISTWKTRFRCALHKLPDIEELNDQNQTEGDEPYRVYKFRKIELETLPVGAGVGGMPVGDDEPESSIGSVGSPVSASYPVENTMLTSGVDTYRAPVTTVYSGVFPKQEVVEKYGGNGYLSPNPRKRTSHKIGGMATTDIKKWQYYDQMRIRETYPDEKRSPTDGRNLYQPRPVEKSSRPGIDECVYDDDDDVGRKMGARKPPNIKDDQRYHKEDQRYHKEDQRYQAMDYETDDDDNMSWNSRGCIQINQPIQSVPSIVPRYPLYYSESASKQQQREQRGFEPYERRYSTESTEVGVIKNVKSVQNKHVGSPHDPNSNSNKEYTYDEQDDNDLFFQSCAKRIKKLDTKSSGYLKLKILEHFYYVENFQHTQNGYYSQAYRGYPSDPPPLISSANARATEQVIDVDDSMVSV